MRFPNRAVPKKRSRPLFVRRLFDGSDESIVFDQSTGKIYHVDGLTRLVWNLCDGRRTWEEIVNALSTPTQRHGGPRSTFTLEEIEDALQALLDSDWVSPETTLISIGASR